MLTFEQKTAINKRFQELYDAGMAAGKHGHYETMFAAMHEAYAALPHSKAVGEREKMLLHWMLAAFEASKVGQPPTPDLERELREVNRLVGALCAADALPRIDGEGWIDQALTDPENQPSQFGTVPVGGRDD